MLRYLGWGVFSRSVLLHFTFNVLFFVPQVECRNLGFVWVCTQIVGSVVLCAFAQRFFNSCFHFYERVLLSCATQMLLLLFAFRDLWKEWGDSNFQIFFHRTASSTTGGWKVVGTFNVLDIYPSEHYGLSFFGPYGCLFFCLLFFCIHFHFASTLCMCVMYLTSI